MLRTRDWLTAPTLVALALSSSGCLVSASPQVWSVKSEIESALPGSRFEKDFAVHLGRLSLALTRGIAGLAADEEDADELELLRGIKKVEVGVFENDGGGHIDGQKLSKIEAALEESHWQMALRQREDDSIAWVYYRLDEKSLRGVFVIVLDRDELTIVRLKGQLDRVLSTAIELAERELSEDGDSLF